MIELTFLKELMFIRQAIQKSVIFITVCIFLEKEFSFKLCACNGCHDVLMMFMKLSDIAILNINNASYCCTINKISKKEAIKLLKNPSLVILKLKKIYFTARKVLFFRRYRYE